MSASRTLLRRNKDDQNRRALPENRRVRPGTANRRCRVISTKGAPIEVTYHATKGTRERIAV